MITPPPTTTRPIIPPFTSHPTLQTSHPNVTLRPFQLTDLPALHALRSQIDVMKWTSTGVVDADLAKTRSWMGRFMALGNEIHSSVSSLSPASTSEVTEEVEHASAGPSSFNFVVIYNEDCEGEGTVIGAAGIHSTTPIAEAGYMIRTEYWGRGIATAIVRAFIDAYWTLEREVVDLPSPVLDEDEAVLDRDGDEDVVGPTREYVKAVIAWENVASRRVLEKCGFVFWRFETVVEFGREIVLGFYFIERPVG